MAKGKSNPRHSDYESVKYEKLEQDDNEEEDDDVMFSQEGIVSKVYNHDDMVVDGSHIQLEKATLVRNSDTSVVHFKKSSLFSKTRNFCFLAIIVFCVVAAVFFGLVMPRLRASVQAGMHQKRTPSWEQNFFNYSTESCVRLYDVNGDGKDDIIVGLAMTERVLHIMDMSHKEAKEFCQSLGEDDHCIGSVVALRGYDGKVLWQFTTLGTVFEINCGHIDVDLDGQTDCIGTGRFATVVAFNPRNGRIFWRIDESRLHGSWNTYNALVVPDLTGDGVKDIVLPHGGDPKIPPERLISSELWPLRRNKTIAICKIQNPGTEIGRHHGEAIRENERRRIMVHVRSSGELLLLDGSNGKVLGRSLEMKDSYGDKETYMSPVLHTTKDGSMYILYGSGGETVGGSFYAISLPDFYKYVMHQDLSQTLAGPGSYTLWGGKQKSEEGIIEIYRSSTKGVMVPPVLVDTTGDGVKDILMLAYDGITTLYNGETLEPLWTANFSGYETYSTPAPGYFTKDNTLDFMLHLSKGFWPDYSHSLTVVIDGTDGRIIWKVFTHRYEMSSDLVAMTTEQHQDLFIFRIQGRPELSEKSKNGSVVKRQKRAEDERSNEDPTWKTNTKLGSRRTRYMPDDGTQGQSMQNPGTGHQPMNKDDLFDTYGDTDAAQNSQYSNQDTDSQYKFSDSEQQEVHDNTEGEQSTEEHKDPVGPNFECEEGALDKTTEVFVVDRSSLTKPLRIYSLPPVKIYYDMTDEDRALVNSVNENHRRKDILHKGSLANTTRSRRKDAYHVPNVPVQGSEMNKTFSGNLCMLLKPTEKTTGALGDLDGDGELDLVLLFDMGGGKHDEKGQYFDHKANTRIVKLNLKQAIYRAQPIDLHPKITGELKEGGRHTKTLTYRKKEQQAWAAYLGSQGDCTFHTET